MIAYKFLLDGLKSQHDGSTWEVGMWRKEHKPSAACVGLNASKLIPDALGYVHGTILAKVEYRGAVIDSGDKVTCEQMRVVHTWGWTKEHSVKLAIYAAFLVLHVYESAYPGDDRPRKAIDSARKFLTFPDAAAYAARAATYAADAAADAATDAAAYAAAYAATYAARAAARAAAYAARAATYAADAATDAAAYAAAYAAADAAAYAARAAAYAATYAARAAADADVIKLSCHRYALRMLKGTL